MARHYEASERCYSLCVVCVIDSAWKVTECSLLEHVQATSRNNCCSELFENLLVVSKRELVPLYNVTELCLKLEVDAIVRAVEIGKLFWI